MVAIPKRPTSLIMNEAMVPDISDCQNTVSVFVWTVYVRDLSTVPKFCLYATFIRNDITHILIKVVYSHPKGPV